MLQLKIGVLTRAVRKHDDWEKAAKHNNPVNSHGLSQNMILAVLHAIQISTHMADKLPVQE